MNRQGGPRQATPYRSTGHSRPAGAAFRFPEIRQFDRRPNWRQLVVPSASEEASRPRSCQTGNPEIIQGGPGPLLLWSGEAELSCRSLLSGVGGRLTGVTNDAVRASLLGAIHPT